jgi:hypothetical protein
MFGLNALFAALARLTRSVNTSADLFDAANDRMKTLLAIDGPPEAPALEHNAEAETPKAKNGRARQPA